MRPIRSIYDRLPIETRSTIRSLVPGTLRRWYAHRHTDVYLISYPKCGRTWLRLMIGRAVSQHYNLGTDEDILFIRWKGKVHPDVPHITVVHEDRPMLKSPDELQTSKARYRDKRVIFLARDPRDVIVSSYFEMSKRGHIFGENPYETRQAVFEGSLADFISNRTGGFDTLLRYYNIWAENRHIPEDFLLVRYEDMKSNSQGQLRRALDFLGLHQLSAETIAEAANFASFDNMRKMEIKGKYQTGILKPANTSDQDSFKTRKGKVNGYLDYLSPAAVEALNLKIQNELSDYFRYNP